MWKRSIKTKIFAAVISLAVLIVLVGVTAVVGHQQLSQTVTSLQSIEAAHAEMLKASGGVQSLRMRVDRYVATGYQPQIKEIRGSYKNLAEALQNVSQLTTDDLIRDHLDRIREHLQHYRDDFDSVVEERELRQTLTLERLPAAAENVLTELRSLGSGSRLSSPHRNSAVAECRYQFALAEQRLLEYFIDPDSSVADAAFGHISDCTRLSRSLSGEASEAPSKLTLALEDFWETGLRAVQATRSYLYLRNVVMASRVCEVVYLTELVTKRTGSLKAEAISEFEIVQRATLRWITLVVSVAICVSVFAAAALVRMIIPPITQLTETFRRLSDGESLGEIPGQDRADELGSMSRAAKVFSEKNHSTRVLLAESQAMGQALTEKTRELETINDELDSFAYVASHDLKSPLRGIRQLASWIQEDAGDLLPDGSKRHLQQLEDRVGKMESLLHDLLDYSRAGRENHESEVVDLDELLDEIQELVNNPDDVEICRDRGLPSVRTPKAPLEQILLNLIENAVKHNHRGSDGQVSVTTEVVEGRCTFSVRDNGPGIDPINHERAFQMYQRVGDRNVEGSGMGLAIVRKQVEQFGGEISLNSSLGAGAEFRFTWPESEPAV